jgi:hypothetical protein
MTHRILLSELKAQRVSPEDFDLLVRTHVADIRAHAEHHDALRAGDEQRQPYPAPWAPKIVLDSIDHVAIAADYEVVDDSPTPEQLLRAAKNALLGRITEAEVAAHHATTAPGKRRLALLREGNVRREDMRRAMAIAAEHRAGAGIVSAIGSMVGLGKKPLAHAEAMARAVEDRSLDDKEFMEGHEARGRRHDALERHAAELAAEVEDIDSLSACEAWQMKPFPEGDR